MKYEGNLKDICHILQCDQIDKFQRIIKLLEQGIQENKLPRFLNYFKLNINYIYDYLYKENSNLFNNEQITLTDIFRQFDTITLRGRTSIDRYFNQQQTQLINHIPEENNNQTTYYHHHHQIDRSFQSILQNPDQISLTSPPPSINSLTPLKKFQPSQHFSPDIFRVQDTSNFV